MGNSREAVHLFNLYQELAAEFATYPEEQNIIYPTLGLTGEAGELANKVKKVIRGDGELDKKACALELGDILWYVSDLAKNLGYSLQDIAEMNIQKLADRRERNALKGNGDYR